MKKKIAILGSTGSIGKTLFKLLEKDKKNLRCIEWAKSASFQKVEEFFGRT